MSMPNKPDNPVGCPSQEVLEECAVHRAHRNLELPDQPDQGPSSDVDGHVRTCAACGERLELLAEETTFFLELLTQGGAASSSDCLDEEHLALYLDGADDPAGGKTRGSYPLSAAAEVIAEQREKTEHHLAACRGCQRRLIALYREIRAVLADMGETSEGDRVTLEELRERQKARPRPESPTETSVPSQVPEVEVRQDLSSRM